MIVHVSKKSATAEWKGVAHKYPFLPIVGAAVLMTAYLIVILIADSQSAVLTLFVVGAAGVLLAKKLGWIALLSASFDRYEALAATLGVIGILFVTVIFHNNSFVLFLLVTILMTMTACLGLNLQFGYAGMLNFSGASMLGIGAYSAAIFGQQEWIPSLLLLPLGGIVAAVIGSLLLPPMLRTYGHYSAVITIAFALLFVTFLDSFQMLGGAQGISVKPMSLFGWNFNNGIKLGQYSIAFYANYLLLALVVTILAGVIVRRIERSWIGLNMDAVRTDETSAACFGVSINSVKIFAFTVGNFIVGFAGALGALVLGYIAPANFTISDSLMMITIILLGGLGSVWGTVLTTAIIQIVPERLQAIQEYRLLIYAILVLVVLRFVPAGLIPRGPRRYFPGDAT